MPLQHPAEMPGMQEACTESGLSKNSVLVSHKECNVECGWTWFVMVYILYLFVSQGWGSLIWFELRAQKRSITHWFYKFCLVSLRLEKSSPWSIMPPHCRQVSNLAQVPGLGVFLSIGFAFIEVTQNVSSRLATEVLNKAPSLYERMKDMAQRCFVSHHIEHLP